MKNFKTAERVSTDISDNYVFARSVLAYKEAAKLVSGTILEAGTGTGYGLEELSKTAGKIVSIDKIDVSKIIDASRYGNVYLKQMQFPPFKEIADSAFDFVISFQVIEHIKNDKYFLEEVIRILKPAGKFIVTTPNRLTSLTRNPFHVREYTPQQFDGLLDRYFGKIERYGVFGNEKVMKYYNNNRASVEKITRFDVLKMQWWAPRFLLRLPYSIFNRINRFLLLKQDTSLAVSIAADDYFIAPVNNDCFDLFYVAEKQ
ncbi:MAG: class I SAM-dependent methyltransferase [Dysgonamonadaceae bacterium]|jgi:SAM-dependent methyltransferase|nr:class I SAM-dependent methyltransferase [Dysgonamonadaceae bacterium]